MRVHVLVIMSSMAEFILLNCSLTPVCLPQQKEDSSGRMSKEVIAAQQKELRHLLKRGAELAYLNGIIDSDTKYKYQTSGNHRPSSLIYFLLNYCRLEFLDQ